MTLNDSNVANTLTKSSQAFPIRSASHLNFLEVPDFTTALAKMFKPKPNALRFGISLLQSWIRFFECTLHIYRIGDQSQ